VSTHPTDPQAKREPNPIGRPGDLATDPLDGPTLMPGMKAPSPATTQMTGDLVLAGGQGFQKLNRLGKGEFGEVWRARAPGGVEVAVKFILRTLSHEASKRELRALEQIRGLRHPFLLQTHQYQSEQDHLIIVMELADKSLSDRLKECLTAGLPGIPVAELVDYLLQAAEALDYLHAQHVTHRDIKPQNLLMQGGHAKVADFGLARQMEQSMDEASMVCGTPYYMAPEVWSGQITVQSDQYALAATYYEMRTGKRLFEAKSAYELLALHVHGDLELGDLPEEEKKVLRRALARSPDQRYPTCLDFARALREATAPTSAISTGPPKRSRFVLVALGGLVTALVLASALAVVLLRPSPTPPGRTEEPKPKVEVNWKPPTGWLPVKADDLLEDRRGRHCYRQLVRDVDGQRVVMVLVPQGKPTDPDTFYIMENKVWNDLYAVFRKDPKAEQLFREYSSRPGCEKLVGGDWQLGAYVVKDGAMVNAGVGPAQGRLPALRMKVTEAHCFAEWLINGRLPSREQYYKAVGLREATMPDMLNGDPAGLALNLLSGPWEVSRGNRDVSPFGCRQLVTNGYEWTRNLLEGPPPREIPVPVLEANYPALYVGHSFLDTTPPTRDDLLQTLRSKDCTSVESLYEVGFRVVLER
jgi:serine/threonine protein kinase